LEVSDFVDLIFWYGRCLLTSVTRCTLIILAVDKSMFDHLLEKKDLRALEIQALHYWNKKSRLCIIGINNSGK
jgi:hypothetical protein